MPHSENRAVLSLATIFSFRMLGLFMILPIFSLYATHIQGATPTLIGIALGIYGLTQAILQIPFGMLSDRIGRKPVITLGLLIFALGSLVAAMSTSITGIILGRALQGGGAIGSTIIALTADLTRVENRTKAMAVIGLTIGLSFMLAMILGPLLNSWVHLSGIFWLTALLALLGIVILFVVVPNPPRTVFHWDAQPALPLFKSILTNMELLRLNLGICLQHAILTASFIAIPIVLHQEIGLKENQQWLLYLSVLIASFFAMLPFIIIAEKKHKMKTIFLIAIATLAITQGILAFIHPSLSILSAALLLFFTAFTFLEASLPSLISKIAPSHSKGTAIGIYSSCQFLGIFLGGSIGGLVFSYFSVNGVFLFCTILAILWLLAAASMQKPPYLTTLVLNIGQRSNEQARELSKRLNNAAGVSEAMIMIEEGIAYLKIDKKQVNQKALDEIIKVI